MTRPIRMMRIALGLVGVLTLSTAASASPWDRSWTTVALDVAKPAKVALRCANAYGLKVEASAATLSGDGRWLFVLAGTAEHGTRTLARIELFANKPAEVLHVFPGDQGMVWAFVPSYTGDHLLLVLSNNAYLWQAGLLRTTTGLDRGPVFDLAEKRLAVETSDNVTVFDLASLEVLNRLPTYGHGNAFTPEGANLVTFDKPAAELWDLATNTKRLTMPMTLVSSDDNGKHVAVSPDGTRIAGATFGAIVYLWDRATGKLIQRTGAGSTEHDQIAFSPDSSRIAIVSWDEIHVHDGKTNEKQWFVHTMTPRAKRPKNFTTDDTLADVRLAVMDKAIRVVGKIGTTFYVEQLAITDGATQRLSGCK